MTQILRFVAYACAAYLVLLAAVWWFQRRLVYFPMGTPPPAARVLPGAQELTFETQDGLQLGAWFVPPAQSGGHIHRLSIHRELPLGTSFRRVFALFRPSRQECSLGSCPVAIEIDVGEVQLCRWDRPSAPSTS